MKSRIHPVQFCPLILLAVVLAALPVTVCQGQPNDTASPFEAHTFTLLSGFTLPYRLLSPERIEPGKKYPLVLFFHGMGERGTDNNKQLQHGAKELATKTSRAAFPCFVVVPQCPVSSLWGADPEPGAGATIPAKPLNVALALVDKLMGEDGKPVDPDRIYVVGLSMGGFATFRALELRPTFFAAAIPVCGGGNLETAKSFAHVPIWIFHGALDRTVPLDNSLKMAAALRTAGGDPGLTVYPNTAHNSWSRTFSDSAVWTWLFSQKRPQVGP